MGSRARGAAARLWVVAVLLWAAAGAAQEDANGAEAADDAGQEAQARALFEAGRVAFDNGRYEAALGHFTEAYELSGRPGFLYNIAHSHQLLGHEREALEAYRAYLEAEPEAGNAGAVRARIRALEESLAQEAAAAESVADAPVPERAAAESGGGEAPVAGWITLGAGLAAAAVGGILLGVAAGAAGEVTGVPEGTPWAEVEGSYDRSGTLGVTGAVLLGVGAAAAAAGVVWVIVGGQSAEARTVTLTPSGVRGAF